MKWIKRITIVVVAVLLLAGCGAQAAASDNAAASDQTTGGGTGNTDTGVKNTQRLRTDYADDALSPVAQLALGTFKLEDTEYAVDSKLAAELLPYWQLYLNMMDSDTAAQQEKDSLISDIQTVMTEDQMDYIASLALTQEDLMSMGSQLNLADRSSSSQDGESSNQWSGRSNGRGGAPAEDMPEGMGPGQGGFSSGRNGEAMDPELLATMQARQAENGGGFARGGAGAGDRMIQPLIQALIELLESKTAS